MRLRRSAPLSAALLLVLAVCTNAADTPEADTPEAGTPASGLPAGDDASVVRIVDGDTIVVSGDRTVRLIGIDTPETKDPRRPVGCFGKEAAARTAEILGRGTAVRLVYDVERHDRFGRTLAYVHRRADGLFVNAALVAEGYALPATYPPNVAHADEFAALGRRARDRGAGLWGACPEPAGADSSRYRPVRTVSRVGGAGPGRQQPRKTVCSRLQAGRKPLCYSSVTYGRWPCLQGVFDG